MHFKKKTEKTAQDYQEKMEKINRQIADLEKLAAKYRSCARSVAQK